MSDDEDEWELFGAPKRPHEEEGEGEAGPSNTRPRTEEGSAPSANQIDKANKFIEGYTKPYLDELGMKLRDYQIKSIRRVFFTPEGAPNITKVTTLLLNHPMGAGKTITGISILAFNHSVRSTPGYKGKPPGVSVVVCTKQIYLNAWRPKLVGMDPSQHIYELYSMNEGPSEGAMMALRSAARAAARGEPPPQSCVIFTSYQTLGNILKTFVGKVVGVGFRPIAGAEVHPLFLVSKNVVIYDEVHNNSSSGINREALHRLSERALKRIGMTGTHICNEPKDIASNMYKLSCPDERMQDPKTFRTKTSIQALEEVQRDYYDIVTEEEIDVNLPALRVYDPRYVDLGLDGTYLDLYKDFMTKLTDSLRDVSLRQNANATGEASTTSGQRILQLIQTIAAIEEHPICYEHLMSREEREADAARYENKMLELEDLRTQYWAQHKSTENARGDILEWKKEIVDGGYVFNIEHVVYSVDPIVITHPDPSKAADCEDYTKLMTTLRTNFRIVDQKLKQIVDRYKSGVYSLRRFLQNYNSEESSRPENFDYLKLKREYRYTEGSFDNSLTEAEIEAAAQSPTPKMKQLLRSLLNVCMPIKRPGKKGATPRKVVISMHSARYLLILKRYVEKHVAMADASMPLPLYSLYGGTSAEDRMALVDRFRNTDTTFDVLRTADPDDPSKGMVQTRASSILFMTMKTGSEGITLVPEAYQPGAAVPPTVMFFVGFWWAPYIHKQAIKRIHRMGQTMQCHQQDIVIADSLESVIYEKIHKQKTELCEDVNAIGTGGIPVTKDGETLDWKKTKSVIEGLRSVCQNLGIEIGGGEEDEEAMEAE